MDPGRKWFSSRPPSLDERLVGGEGKLISMCSLNISFCSDCFGEKHFKHHNTSFGEIISCEDRSEKLNQFHPSGFWKCACKLNLNICWDRFQTVSTNGDIKRYEMTHITHLYTFRGAGFLQLAASLTRSQCFGAAASLSGPAVVTPRSGSNDSRGPRWPSLTPRRSSEKAKVFSEFENKARCAQLDSGEEI